MDSQYGLVAASEASGGEILTTSQSVGVVSLYIDSESPPRSTLTVVMEHFARAASLSTSGREADDDDRLKYTVRLHRRGDWRGVEEPIELGRAQRILTNTNEREKRASISLISLMSRACTAVSS